MLLCIKLLLLGLLFEQSLGNIEDEASKIKKFPPQNFKHDSFLCNLRFLSFLFIQCIMYTYNLFSVWYNRSIKKGLLVVKKLTFLAWTRKILCGFLFYEKFQCGFHCGRGRRRRKNYSGMKKKLKPHHYLSITSKKYFSYPFLPWIKWVCKIFLSRPLASSTLRCSRTVTRLTYSDSWRRFFWWIEKKTKKVFCFLLFCGQ